MNIDVKQLQKYRSTLKQYRKKMKQIDDIEHAHKKEKHEKNDEINHIYKQKMKSILKKFAEIKISFSSAKRRIKDLSSIISDYGFIADYFENHYTPIEITNDRSPTKMNLSAMKEILRKKEKRYISKLNFLKSEKSALKEKKYQLSAKKIQIEQRYEKIRSIKNSKNNGNNSLDLSDQSDDLFKYTGLQNQNDDSKIFIDSTEGIEIDENEIDQQTDLIDQQLLIQEQQLNELIMTNQLRREKIESKSSEIRLLKKTYLSNQNKININYCQDLIPEKQYSDPKYDYDQEYASEQCYEEEYQEQYEQLVSKQKKIDEENKSIDLLIAKNNQIRSETESEYEKKLKRITQLTDQSSEIDKLIILIHKMNDEIIESKEKLAQLDLSKKRIMRQNMNITQSIEKLKNDQKELKKREIDMISKKKSIDEQEINLKNHLRQYEEDIAFVDSQINEINDKKSEVEKLEYQMTCLEEKVEGANEEIKRLTDLVDKLLLNASSNRADSRMNRLHEMIDSKSDIDISSNNISENSFYYKFLKSSTNSKSSPK